MMDYTLWLRFALLLVLPNFGSAILDGLSTLDEIYAISDQTEGNIDSKCQEIVGRVPDCAECYTCDDDAVAIHRRNNHEISKLTLSDGICNSTVSICCVSQANLRFREKDNSDQSVCGVHNPDGYPRRLRPSVRSVLPGEYPWRAWIYNWQEPTLPLCAGTFINKDSQTVLTSASCVDGLLANALMVRFDKSTNNYSPIYVRRVDVHDDFDSSKHTNDIAILGLEHVPASAHAACLPIQPALHATACVAVSNDDYFIDEVIPKQTNCVDKTEVLDLSRMCGVTRQDDFNPEAGGGLFCMDEEADTNTFILYGIHQSRGRNGSAAFNTNVTHFAKWISSKMHSFKIDLF